MDLVDNGPYRHQALVTALTAFYTTLSDLCYILPSDIIYPSSHTGKHTPAAIDASQARHAGFNDEVIDLMYHLPYLSEEASYIQLAPNTTKFSYLRQEDDGDGVFGDARDVLSQDRADVPAHMLTLTWGQVYGTFVVYDVNTGRVSSWDPMADDHPGIPPSLPSSSPEELFGGWIAKFRSLDSLPLDLYGNIIFKREPEDLAAPPQDYKERDRQWWYLERDRYEGERMLKEVYLECGWGVEFRKQEFERKREQWRVEVLEPMEERLVERFRELEQ